MYVKDSKIQILIVEEMALKHLSNHPLADSKIYLVDIKENNLCR